MAHQTVIVDVSSIPELSRLVQEVVRTGETVVLQADGAAATLSPSQRRRRGARAMSDEEFRAGLHATAGMWQGQIDANELKRQLRELQADERAPRNL